MGSGIGQLVNDTKRRMRTKAGRQKIGTLVLTRPPPDAAFLCKTSWFYESV
jgi:hypothetical protein